MRAQLILDPSDLLKIAVLVHDKNTRRMSTYDYNVMYDNNEITLIIGITAEMDMFAPNPDTADDVEYTVNSIEAKFYSDSESFDIEVPTDIFTQIKDVL